MFWMERELQVSLKQPRPQGPPRYPTNELLTRRALGTRLSLKRQKTKWRLQLLGALRIMGEIELVKFKLPFSRSRR